MKFHASCGYSLRNQKTPPLDIIDSFLKKFGHDDGESIHSDQGGELAKSSTLTDIVLRNHSYVFEPTGADSPSQVKTYNDQLAVRTRTLLYGAKLPAKYWSAVLLHAVYLNNRLVHTVTKKLHLKDSMAINRTSSISKCLDLTCVLNNLGIGRVNWIITTLRASF